MQWILVRGDKFLLMLSVQEVQKHIYKLQDDSQKKKSKKKKKKKCGT